MLVLLIAVTVGLLSLVLKLLKKPMKLFFKLLIHAAAGFLLLLLVNILGGFFDVSLPVNWLSAAVSGLLGIPGVILLFVFKYFL